VQPVSAVSFRKSWAAPAILFPFPDLPRYLLYSVTPLVFKGDSLGLHWQVLWQERSPPHRPRLAVRVYLRDGCTMAERLE
jgi:hypothetical protein